MSRTVQVCSAEPGSSAAPRAVTTSSGRSTVQKCAPHPCPGPVTQFVDFGKEMKLLCILGTYDKIEMNKIVIVALLREHAVSLESLSSRLMNFSPATPCERF